jgi:hypothetical protein
MWYNRGRWRREEVFVVSQDFVSKYQAIMLITLETGYGRYIIERAMDELVSKGLIHLEEDPADHRKYRMPRSEIAIIVKRLRGEA